MTFGSRTIFLVFFQLTARTNRPISSDHPPSFFWLSSCFSTTVWLTSQPPSWKFSFANWNNSIPSLQVTRLRGCFAKLNQHIQPILPVAEPTIPFLNPQCVGFSTMATDWSTNVKLIDLLTWTDGPTKTSWLWHRKCCGCLTEDAWCFHLCCLIVRSTLVQCF